AMLMQDGRMPDLETQALGAILSHFEPDRLPSLTELRQIAVFERSLFSHQELAGYLVGGPPPSLPQPTTPEEIRGRRHFEPGGQIFAHSAYFAVPDPLLRSLRLLSVIKKAFFLQ